MFVTDLDVRAYQPNEWVVLRALCWRLHIDGANIGVTDPDLRYVEVPRGFITDLASIPKPLRSVLDVNGPSREPAVLHDYLYCSQRGSRLEADRLFRFALACAGVGWITRTLYFAGVRLGGWIYYGRRSAGLHRNDFVPLGYWDKHP